MAQFGDLAVRPIHDYPKPAADGYYCTAYTRWIVRYGQTLARRLCSERTLLSTMPDRREVTAAVVWKSSSMLWNSTAAFTVQLSSRSFNGTYHRLKAQQRQRSAGRCWLTPIDWRSCPGITAAVIDSLWTCELCFNASLLLWLFRRVDKYDRLPSVYPPTLDLHKWWSEVADTTEWSRCR